MSLKKTLILAVFLAAALLYINKIELPKEQAKKQAAQLFGKLDRKTFQKIGVTNQHSTFEMQRSAEPPSHEESWELSDPKGARIEPSRINTILSELEQLKIDSALPKDEVESDLSVYGLKDPEIKVEVEYKPEGDKEALQKKEISLGKLNQYVSKRYARFDQGPEIYLLSDLLYQSLSEPVDKIRDRTPIEFIDAEIYGLKIESADRTFEFKRLDITDGSWEMVVPTKALANSSAVSEAMRIVRNSYVDEFLSADKAQDFLGDKAAKPTLSVTFNYSEESKRAPIVVKFWEKKGAQQGESTPPEKTHFAIDGQPFVYSINIAPSAQLIKGVEGYRERKLFQFASDNLEELSVESNGAQSIKLIKTGESPVTWSVNGKQADDAFVNQLINNLSQFEAESFAEPGKDYGFDKPSVKVTLSLKKQADSKESEQRVLLIGKKLSNSDKYYAAIAGKLDDPFVITEQSFKHANPSEESLLKVEAAPEASPEASLSAAASPAA